MGDCKTEMAKKTPANDTKTKKSGNWFTRKSGKKDDASPEDNAQTFAEHLEVCVNKIENLVISKEDDLKTETAKADENAKKLAVLKTIELNIQTAARLAESYADIGAS